MISRARIALAGRGLRGIWRSTHLLMDMDPHVVRGVLDELKSLVAPERRGEPIVAAKTSVPKPIVPPVHEGTVTASAATQRLSAGWPPPTNLITPDVTCSKC